MFASVSRSLTTTGKNKKQPSCQKKIRFRRIKTTVGVGTVLVLLTDLSFIFRRWWVIIYPQVYGHTDTCTSRSVRKRSWLAGRWCTGRASLQREDKPSNHPLLIQCHRKVTETHTALQPTHTSFQCKDSKQKSLVTDDCCIICEMTKLLILQVSNTIYGKITCKTCTSTKCEMF